MNTSMIVGPGIPESVEARSSIENPNTPLTWASFAELLAGPPSGSGEPVNVRTALRVSTVWACVEIVSNSVARLPLITYRRKGDADDRERAKDHPLYRTLRLRPNQEMSAFSMVKTLVMNRMLSGAGYAEIVRRPDGITTELVPIETGRVTKFRAGGELRFQVAGINGAPAEMLLQRDIIHVPGLSFNGVDGLSVIACARETIGAALASDKFQGTMMRNGLRPAGVLKHPKTLTAPALARLRETFQATYGGSANAGKALILEEGMEWAAGVMTMDEAQFIETGQFRCEDICRWFGVAPHKVQNLLRSTNNNIEQQSLDFLSDTVEPVITPIEQEFNFKLFGPDEADEYFCEFMRQKLIQMDANARGQLYARLLACGAICPDDICRWENLNALPDDRGKSHWIPMNLIPLMTPDQLGEYITAVIKKAGSGGGAAPGGNQSGNPAADPGVNPPADA